MSNPLTKLIDPWYPATALGLERGMAAMVQLEGGRKNAFALRRAASITIADSLIRPGFDEPNIADLSELAEVLTELGNSAGLLRQRKWSIALPEASSRTLIFAEYESVFAALGWRSGLILPRHVGESRWLTRNGNAGDSLLVTSHDEGFTAAIFRDRQPLILRSVLCEPGEREDEFYRLLLFYRDRRSSEAEHGAPQALARLLVVGTGFGKDRASEIANETLGGHLRVLGAADVGLQLPAADLSFDLVAAPAGLATLHWT